MLAPVLASTPRSVTLRSSCGPSITFRSCTSRVPVASCSPRIARRHVTAAAGRADSFTVSNAQFSQTLRNLTNLNAWMDICDSSGVEFQGVDNFAAIRKLVELLRNAPGGMPAEVRRRVSELADGMFQATTRQVLELDATQQQVLVLELSQLGVVFISPEWHAYCPPVPVPLLNGLLDSLLQRLRSLRGGQVGVLLISLQRLQLCDSDAYGFILQEIERQLKVTKGENSWYRHPDHLGKLVRGVVTVFLGIPQSMSRDQANSVLTLLSDAVVGLPRSEWSGDEWKNIASILESFAEVPQSLDVPCGAMYNDIARRLVEQKPRLSGKVLAQVMAVYSSGRHENAAAVATLVDTVHGQYDALGARTVADVAEALSMAGEQWSRDISSMMAWALEAQDVPNDAGLRMLAAGARSGSLTDVLWDDYCARFGGTALGHSLQYSSAADREVQLLLEAILHYGAPTATVSALCRTIASWMNAEQLRLWRIVPYLTVVARVGFLGTEGDKYKDDYKRAQGTVFEAAQSAIKKEIHPQMVMAQRGQLLMTAISASITACRKDTVEELLSIEGISSYLQDQGEPVTHVLAEAICKAEHSTGSASAVGAVWDSIMSHNRPLSEMQPTALSRLAHTLWECQPYEAYLHVIVETASGMIQQPTNDVAGLLRELQLVYEVVTHVKNIRRPKAINAEAQAFLDQFQALQSGRSPMPQAANQALADSADGEPVLDSKSLGHMTVGELQGLLLKRGLPLEGRKFELIDRLLDPNAAPAPPVSEADNQRAELQAMTVAELKNLLAQKGMKVTGKKQQLIDRVMDADGVGEDATPGTAQVDELSTIEGAQDVSASSQGSESPDDVAPVAAGGQAELESLTVADLKELLRSNGLKLGGKKAELIERCMANGIRS